MADVRPVVRYLIICEEIPRDPADPNRITLDGLILAIYSVGEPPFPLRYPEFCVFVELTDARGQGHVRVDLVQADTDTVIFRTATRAVWFGNDPLAVRGIIFRIQNCSFPAPGLYWVQFWCNDECLAQQPLLLR